MNKLASQNFEFKGSSNLNVFMFQGTFLCYSCRISEFYALLMKEPYMFCHKGSH